MRWHEFKYLVYSDLYRYTGKYSITILIKNLIWNPSFKYSFSMRLCTLLRQHKIARFSLYIVAKGMLRHYSIRYGISVPASIRIGSGFYIAHIGGIYINDSCRIGKNCNITTGVTLGQANRGPRKGAPVVGDDVYIGPGAKLVGKVKIGNNAAIGANCVVTKDIPDNAVVVGVPGRVISYDGSASYVNRTDY